MADDSHETEASAHGRPDSTANNTVNGSLEPEKIQEQKGGRKRAIIIAGSIIVGIIILVLVIALPVALTKKNKPSNSSSSGSSSGSGSNGGGGEGEGGGGSTNNGNPGGIFTGGDGSRVTLEDGSTFEYKNPHGGHWYYDVNDPFNNGARSQSWNPALNESFRYGVDRIRGVNLGGWLVIEPFIVPALFQKYPSAVDEYTLHQAMAADTANGGINQIEEHYRTFITEKDFAEIAQAGLNYVRIPIGYWAIETRQGEPYLEKVAWKYFLKAIAWSRKYGLRINLDLHSTPGSQNDWNHSGRRGTINMLYGPMGLANAQRTLDYIRILAEFVSQPQYRDVVTFFGVLNEPREVNVMKPALESFFAQAYRIVREAGGTGEGQGPWISISDGLGNRDEWGGYLNDADRLSLDSHPYDAFGDNQNGDSWGSRVDTPCRWGREFNNTSNNFQAGNGKAGLITAGEWSLAVNDCGLFLNGVDEGTRFDGSYTPSSIARTGGCERWTEWEKYDDATKGEIMNFAKASMDGLRNYFFWTWKIGPSRTSGKVETPMWSYQLGYEHGWIPKDPRAAEGFCGGTNPVFGTVSQGTNTPPNVGFYAWPPANIEGGGPPNQLYTYTQTGAIPTLTGATLSISGAKPTKTPDVGNGWNSGKDSAGMYVPIQGCQYPKDPWDQSAPLPFSCGNTKREVPVKGIRGRGVDARATAAPAP